MRPDPDLQAIEDLLDELEESIKQQESSDSLVNQVGTIRDKVQAYHRRRNETAEQRKHELRLAAQKQPRRRR